MGLIYFISTGGTIIHDGNTFLKTPISLSGNLSQRELKQQHTSVASKTHSRPAMLSFYLFQQMLTRYHSLRTHEKNGNAFDLGPRDLTIE